MSRTFARLELSVSQNGNKVKTFAEDVSHDEKDMQTLLNALQKAKESSNEFLTTLVEEDRISKAGGVVISHSKRKHFDEGNAQYHFTKLFMLRNSIDDSYSYRFFFSLFQMKMIKNGKQPAATWMMIMMTEEF